MDDIALYGIMAALYVSLCAVTGFMARKTSVGFWGFLFLSMLITPFLPLLALFLTRPAERPAERPVIEAPRGR